MKSSTQEEEEEVEEVEKGVICINDPQHFWNNNNKERKPIPETQISGVNPSTTATY